MVALAGGELLPEEGVDAVGDEMVAGRLDRLADERLQWGDLALRAGPGELAGDVEVLDGGVGGEDLQGRGVGGELVVGVGEARVARVVQGVHGVELAADLEVHEGHELVEEDDVRGRALPEDHEHGAPHVVAVVLLGDLRAGLRGDAPRPRHLEATTGPSFSRTWNESSSPASRPKSVSDGRRASLRTQGQPIRGGSPHARVQVQSAPM